MPILNTETHGDLTRQLIADIVLQLLSYVAETEREFIRKRQAEGIASAKARGVRFGAPERPVPANYPKVLETWRSGRCSTRRAARLCGVARATFMKWTRRTQPGENFDSPLSGPLLPS